MATSDLSDIKGIGKTSLELLEAAGILDVATLGKSDSGVLAAELERANRLLAIAKRAPRQRDIEKWIGGARKRLGLDAPPSGPEVIAPEPGPAEVEEEPAPESEPGPAVDYEATSQVQEWLVSAPAAIPLPARLLIAAGVGVTEIPVAPLLNHYSGDLEIRITERKVPRGIPRTPNAARSRPAAGSYVRISESAATQRLNIDTTRIRSFEDMEARRVRLPAVKSAPAVSNPSAAAERDRLAVLRAPLEKTNRGRDLKSRRYIRGVLHTHPWTMAFGAAVTLAMMALVVPAVVSAALLLLSDLAPSMFGWVPPWLLALPCALPLLGLLYLIFGVKCRCLICNQRQFFPRACIKNSKAHHIPGMGLIAPTALHMLLFRWFRCIYCGTPVRLKK